MERSKAEGLLKRSVNDPEAKFRDGQWEAIDAIVNHRRKLIVVQRTGWGKSTVYFLSTRLLRDRGYGVTIIVSPLLALMRNQIDAATRIGIRAETINSTNPDSWPDIRNDLVSDHIDAILISPERLSNERFVEEVLTPVADRVGLFVVDEVHCISDWGHDFRPDYQRLLNVLRQMPLNTPVLGTTATANNRVVADVTALLGDIEIQRGPLVRDSLCLQTLRIPDQASRLAWLVENIPELPGTGIVYVLTVRDADQVASWLNSHGISAGAYYSNVKHDDFETSDLYRQHLEDQLFRNEIKVLVATTALGMGYDKPDVGFVIHYQAPGSVVAYYQQVGRAGRAIDQAYGVLLAGREDHDIHEYFRSNAFPEEDQVKSILETLSNHDGLTVFQLQQHLNVKHGVLDKALKILSVENPSSVIRDGNIWFRTPVRYQMDHARIKRLTYQRESEWKEVQDYIDTNSCLMAYLRNALDDSAVGVCGRCSVCQGKSVVGTVVSHARVVEATRILKRAERPFRANRQVAIDALPDYDIRGNISPEFRPSEGRILSRWGDAGWGHVVAKCKQSGHIQEDLIQALVEMIVKRWRPGPPPEWVTCVPSLRQPTLVSDFAERTAELLRLPFLGIIDKIIDNKPQKSQQNRFHQCRNLDGVFRITHSPPATPVLLVDDVIDSGWTMTILAVLLRKAGSGPVYPVALASANPGGLI